MVRCCRCGQRGNRKYARTRRNPGCAGVLCFCLQLVTHHKLKVGRAARAIGAERQRRRRRHQAASARCEQRPASRYRVEQKVNERKLPSQNDYSG